MDTPEDSKFLNQFVAEQYNPYREGEYLVIKNYPKDKRLCCVYRNFDYYKARNNKDLENLAHDYSCFVLRIFHQGKLYEVIDKEPGEISREQDWKIHPNYFEAHYDRNTDGKIEVCDCSYPYFWALISYLTIDNEPSEKWHPVTCLADDEGREVANCPNCGRQLIDNFTEEDYDEDEEDYEPPITCNGCSNYHGKIYNGNLLICAIHPHGSDDESCPDFVE